MSDQMTLTPVVANDGPAQDAVAAAVLDTQRRIIDAAVRQARDNGWCGEFERVMGLLFPDGPPDGGREFVDSDGFSCRGYDRDGFNQDGYDSAGYDRDGFTPAGWDREGYNRDGFNRQGWNRQGLNRDGRDRNHPEVRAEYRYDYQGYDRDGFNERGIDRRGYSREYYEAQGTSPYRYRYTENRWGERDVEELT